MIDDIFNDSNEDNLPMTDLANLIDLEVIDNAKLSNQSKTEAKNLIDGVYEYFLENKLMESNAYLRAKKAIETSTLGGLIKQLYLLETSVSNYLQIINVDPTKIGYVQFIIGMQKMYREFSREVNMLIRNISEELKEIQSTNAIEIPNPSATNNTTSTPENTEISSGGTLTRSNRDMNDRIRARMLAQKKRIEEEGKK